MDAARGGRPWPPRRAGGSTLPPLCSRLPGGDRTDGASCAIAKNLYIPLRFSLLFFVGASLLANGPHPTHPRGRYVCQMRCRSGFIRDSAGSAGAHPAIADKVRSYARASPEL
jgi:hypothetical protein